MSSAVPTLKVSVFGQSYVLHPHEVEQIANIVRGSARYETDYSTKPYSPKLVRETSITFPAEVIPADVVSTLLAADALGGKI